MVRLVVVFAVLLMISALSLVTVRFQSRELFVASERLASRAHELDTEWRRLQLERAELARNVRIDQVARNELGLVPVTPDRTIYLRPGETLAPRPGPEAGGRR
ncbi:cell division protein FtsL [Castellaniella sp. S9]|uniref:cell division protein FtsL n=1 Tax=Castellaniella sp. S9 TaxID=2993652 RepID=UPI0022B4C5A6|nr:cell division protein FtsL [Castellaniella sp. S9]